MNLLLIFVKDPQPGQVKTRLAKDIGEVKALEAYRTLLSFTLEVSQGVDCQKVVYYGNAIPEWDLWAMAGYERRPQFGGDLGVRMLNAFASGFEEKMEKIVIIGSDCAQISPQILESAFAALDDHDFVIGPAKDGGYYLLGMRELFTPVFEKKTWSSGSVFADTLADLDTAGKSYYLLPILSDIDIAEDLKGTFLEDLLLRRMKHL